MILFRSELCTGYNYIASRRTVKRAIIHEVLGIARRVDLHYILRVTPQLSNVSISPRAICCNDVRKFATQAVKEHQNPVVDSLDHSLESAICMLIVELVRFDLFEHVAADGRVVGVAHNAAPKQQLYEWVGKPHSDRVNEHVAWSDQKRLSAYFIVSQALPKKCT